MKLSALALSCGRAWPAHAGVGADLAQTQGIVAAGVSHAAIGMMNQVLQRTAARSDSLVERFEGQAGLEMIGERPADDFPRKASMTK